VEALWEPFGPVFVSELVAHGEYGDRHDHAVQGAIMLSLFSPLTVLFVAILGVVHISLYSAISLSTAEMKPRGTYFEAPDLLPGLSAPTYRMRRSLQKSKEPPLSPCDHLEEMGLPCWKRCATNLTWTALRPRGMDDEKETLALIFAPPRKKRDAAGNNDARTRRHKAACSPLYLVDAFLNHMDEEGRFQKTLAVLFPGEGDGDAAIEEWLNGFYGRTMEHFPIAGALRAAVVVEFPTDECVSVSAPSYSSQLGVVGDLGRLPNMDLVNLVSNAFRPANTRIERFEASQSSTPLWASELQPPPPSCQHPTVPYFALIRFNALTSLSASCCPAAWQESGSRGAVLTLVAP
jgi:hypothetical protein